MEKCIACGGKAKEKRIGLNYCKTCAINFDNRINSINDAKDEDTLDKTYSKVLNSINTRDSYIDNDSKEAVLKHFDEVFKNRLAEINTETNSKNAKGIVYEITGARGRTLEVYKNKVIIKTSITIGSVITGNATDGQKVIYYKDVIGLQFKQSGAMIGYLQLETASSTMNNEKNNFFNENTFTFEDFNTPNKLMEEVFNYLDNRIEEVKTGNNNISIADEILKFKSLLDNQVITLDEFELKKKQLLNK